MDAIRIYSLLSVLVLCNVSSAQTDRCDDDDTSLCSLMKVRIPHMCTDPCMTKFCKRTCGLCPFDCYECNEVDDASQCKTVKTCAKGQYCFTAQTFTITFSEAYRLGCGPIKTCLQYSAIAHSHGIEAGCCNQDKCNNRPPALLKINTPPNNTVNIVPTRDPSFCVNMDDDVCTTLALVHPNLCSDSCVSDRICPHMCKKCFYCLDCTEVDNPSNCTDTTACGFGKQCYGFEKIGTNFQPAVQLGCIDTKVCDLLQTPSGHVFGKRDRFTFEGGCCMGDWCNAHPNGVQTTQAVTASVTTPAPVLIGANCTNRSYNQCPQGYKPIGKNCYLMGSRAMSRTESEVFCHERCAHLVKFSDKLDILSVFSHYYDSHKDSEVFTSLIRKTLKQDSFGQWIWESDNSVANSQLIEHNFFVSRYSCATAYIAYNNGTNGHVVYTYGLQPKDCSMTAVPMCFVSRI